MRREGVGLGFLIKGTLKQNSTLPSSLLFVLLLKQNNQTEKLEGSNQDVKSSEISTIHASL